MKYIQTYEASKSTEKPFIQSAKRGSRKAVEDFIKQGVDINMIGEYYDRTALMNASLNNNLMIVDTLIKADADVNLQDKDGRTALMMASTPKIIQKLLDVENLDINIKSYAGDSVAMEWLRYTFVILTLDNLKKFIEKGLDLDIVDNNGFNFYDKLKDKLEHLKIHMESDSNVNTLSSIEKFMDENYPRYKKMWELKRDIKAYNI